MKVELDRVRVKLGSKIFEQSIRSLSGYMLTYIRCTWLVLMSYIRATKETHWIKDYTLR